jgi:hypothetical protein
LAKITTIEEISGYCQKKRCGDREMRNTTAAEEAYGTEVICVDQLWVFWVIRKKIAGAGLVFKPTSLFFNGRI